MGILSSEAKAYMIEAIKEFSPEKDDLEKRRKLRAEFMGLFTPEKIKELKPEDYFPGLGKKEDCLGYQLEWGTRALGSIKGGSLAKYGPKDQFKMIKKLIVELTSLKDDKKVFYRATGELTEAARNLSDQAIQIKGMKYGNTVLGKLLSIYYPDTFLPMFADQVHMIHKVSGSNETELMFGLEAYLRNNYDLLKIKDELAEEPLFAKALNQVEFTNDFYYKFLYFCFPKLTKDEEEKKTREDDKVEALEAQHYQSLLHRNFKKFFKGFKYYDEEVQHDRAGHYPTDEVGEMDFLAVDAENNLIVIELKRKGTDETLAQLCRYMGWAQENLADKGQKVMGLIVSETKDLKLEYAIKVVPNVSLKRMALDVAIADF